MNGKIDQLDGKIDSRIDQVNGRIDQLDSKIDQFREEMRTEMRRNTDRIMLALINHSHGDGTPPVFTIPPEAEPAVADD